MFVSFLFNFIPMKKYFIPFYIFILFPFTVSAQKEITTKWYHNVLDTFHSIKKNWRSCIPFDMVEVNEKEVILGTYDFFAWTIRKIDKKTGKIVWITAKTPNYPDSSRKRYYLDNMFLRSDGNIDVHGVKSFLEESPTTPGSLGWGNPIKITYDSKTSKEKTVLFPPQANKTEVLVVKPGALGSYMPMDNGKGHYMMTLRDYPEAYILASLDSNLVLKDTLSVIDYVSDVDKENARSFQLSKPTKINSNIYLTVGVWKGISDTATIQRMFYKIDLKGNIKIRKKLGVPLYNILDYGDIKPISDGFLAHGLVDTTYGLFKDLKKASNTSMVAKIDTNGTVLWKSFLALKDIEKLEFLQTCEDKKRGGYWVLAASLIETYPFLFYIDKKGKSTFIAKIKLADNEEATFPSFSFWCLKDGNLLLSFEYIKAYYDKSYPKAWGVSLIEAAELDKILATSEPDILPSFLVNIYPNPAHDILNVSVAESDELLNIACYDLQGRAMYHCNFQSFTQINTSDWQRGLYAYTIRDTRGRLVKSGKVIVE
jgi:hypothetical protein